MEDLRFTYWKSGRFFIGYLEDFPDYHTQGKTLQELTGNLMDILIECNSGRLPQVRRSVKLKLKSTKLRLQKTA